MDESVQRADRSERDAGRRRLLKTAAWAVPAIMVAAPVPAYAASGGDAPGAGAQLSYDNTTIQRDIRPAAINEPPWVRYYFDGAEGNTELQNVYQPTQVVVTLITLQLRFAPGVPVTTDLAQVAISGSGWTKTSVSATGSATVYTFTWTGTLVSGGSTSVLRFRIPPANTTILNSSVPTFTVDWSASSPQALNTPNASSHI